MVITPRRMAFAPIFDYNYDDPNLYNNEFRLSLTSKTWPTLPSMAAGIPIRGDNSGATGRMCAFETKGVVDMVYITDSIGNWEGGETVRAAEDPQGHFFVLAGGASDLPTISTNTTTKSMDLVLPAAAPNDYTHAIRTSNVYIPQARQETTTITFSVASTPSDSSGVARRFGLFDDNNGVFFEIAESDGKTHVSAPVSTSAKVSKESPSLWYVTNLIMINSSNRILWS